MANPDQIDVFVGQSVRTRRIASGMSQTQLGEKIGVTFQQIQKYERGTNRISSSQLVRISGVLNCRPEELFPEQDDQTLGTLDPNQIEQRRAGLELAKNYTRISDPKIRAALRHMIYSIADGTSPYALEELQIA